MSYKRAQQQARDGALVERVDGHTILVTGAGGFIGPAVVRELLARGARLRALLGPACHNIRSHAADGLENATADITDEASLLRLASDCDTVVHLAGPASVAESFKFPVEYARAHVVGTSVVLDACRKARVRRFVYMSSAEVYGRATVSPVTEAHPSQPRSPYAAAKSCAEQLVRIAADANGMEAVILRPFSVYGPGMSEQSLIGTILRMLAVEDEIVLRDLRPVRDYCYVDDVAVAVAKCCAVDLRGMETINIGTGCGTSVADLVRLVLLLANREMPQRQVCDDTRPATSEIYSLLADTTRARDVLAWQASASLEVGLKRMLEKST